MHNTEGIRSLHTFDRGVLALSQTSLRCQLRRGIPVFTHTSANMMEMQCMLQVLHNSFPLYSPVNKKFNLKVEYFNLKFVYGP